MRKNILQRICELESVDISKTKLHMGIDDELGEPENFAAQVERVPETRLFTLLCSQGPEGLQLEGLSENNLSTYLTGFRFML